MGEQRPQVADRELAALDRLVGTWRLSGGWVWPGGGYEVTGTRIATAEAPAVEDDR